MGKNVPNYKNERAQELAKGFTGGQGELKKEPPLAAKLSELNIAHSRLWDSVQVLEDRLKPVLTGIVPTETPPPEVPNGGSSEVVTLLHSELMRVLMTDRAVVRLIRDLEV